MSPSRAADAAIAVATSVSSANGARFTVAPAVPDPVNSRLSTFKFPVAMKSFVSVRDGVIQEYIPAAFVERTSPAVAVASSGSSISLVSLVSPSAVIWLLINVVLVTIAAVLVAIPEIS